MILRYTSPTVEFLQYNVSTCCLRKSEQHLLLDQHAVSEHTAFTAVARRECRNVPDREDRREPQKLCCTREHLIHPSATKSVEHQVAQVLNPTAIDR